MNKQTEALKMVTDILDDELWFPNKYPDEAIPVCFIEALKACKEALEQPAQEPVAWMSEGGIFTRTKEHAEIWSNNGGKVTPVYTHPAPSFIGLNDDEMMEIWCSDEVESTLDFGRAIEQALKEKNHGDN